MDEKNRPKPQWLEKFDILPESVQFGIGTASIVLTVATAISIIALCHEDMSAWIITFITLFVILAATFLGCAVFFLGRSSDKK